MKLTTLSVAVAAFALVAQSAQAREHHRAHFSHREARNHHYARHVTPRARFRYARIERRHGRDEGTGYARDWSGGTDALRPGRGRERHAGGYGSRPAAWCGWEMRHLVGADPGPSYNLARNWARWGHSGPVGVGAVVVWSHHVGKIVGREGDQWVIESGNDGHRLRTRPRSIAGAIAVRWG